MICTAQHLVNELQKIIKRCGDDFISVVVDDNEYVINDIVHTKNHTDVPLTHLSLRCVYGGDGEVKREYSE